MAESRRLEWSTRGDDPDNPKPVSTFPSIGIEHVLSYNIVPVDSPGRLENHKTPLESLLAATNSPLYAIEHSSTKGHQQGHIKTYETDAGPEITRELDTDAATSYTIKSARYRPLYEKLKSPSAAKKALASWKKQGKEGLPPQHMTLSSPTVRKVEGKPHLCISCTVDEAYPNFHIQCIFQYLNHTEKLNSDTKEVRLAFATLQTRENRWVVALEQQGQNDTSIKAVVGGAEYARLESIAISSPDQGQSGNSAAGNPISKKIIVPKHYDVSRLWCQTEGFYQVNLYIPETSVVENS